MTTKRKEELHKGEKVEQKPEKLETGENSVISDELIRWMTEPTNPNMIPRADNG